MQFKQTGMNSREVARGLAWFGIGLGLTEPLAPRTVARAAGLRGTRGCCRFSAPARSRRAHSSWRRRIRGHGCGRVWRAMSSMGCCCPRACAPATPTGRAR